MSNLVEEPLEGSDDELARDPPPLPQDPGESMDATRQYDPEADPDADADFVVDSAVYGEKPPKSLGKYTIQERIGAGGMGVVWKANDPDLQRAVAIKVLGPHLRHSQTARRRFQREARAAAAISHPNVLTIHAVEEHDHAPFLVMEYVSGQSLKEYVTEKGKLPHIEVFQLASQIAQGLAAAHAQGVIHRDVKPGNVMLHDGGTRVRLADFGLARITFDNSELTSHGQYVGTPAYMPPEQLRGGKVDARADLFSLGCVIYYMLVGYSPFQGKTQGETIHRILGDESKPLHEIDPSVPPFLSELVSRLLKRDPEERYQSAFEVADVVSRFLSQINRAATDDLSAILSHNPALLEQSDNVDSSKPKRGTLWAAVLAIVALTAFFVLPELIPNKQPTPGEQPGTSIRNGEALATLTEPQEGAGSKTVPPPDLPKMAEITVGGDSEFKTISQAVARAASNCTITVTGPGPYVESVKIDGSELDGLQLIADSRVRWLTPDPKEEHRALLIEDVSDVLVQGFDFEVTEENGRALHLQGATGNVTIQDCSFQHMQKEHRLSLALAESEMPDSQHRIRFMNCRFSAAEGPVMCLALGGSNGGSTRAEARNCQFTTPGTHIMVTSACRSVALAENVFIGGNNAINLSYAEWRPDSHVEIVNNTFVETRYWFGLMASFRGATVPTGKGTSRICNNLILGGVRMQGGEDQWQHVETSWIFDANWWEPSSSTTKTAGRDGRVAEFKDNLKIPNRDQPDMPDYLRPAPGSILFESSCCDDLPRFIGAKGPEQ
ncbi:MAG: protein kinase domain-containing protein [Planctomycetales bacterium]